MTQFSDLTLRVISGNRGIGHLLCKDELLRASLSLSHARSVLITTGFPTHFNHEPPEETDGPPGALALAAFLQALGKGVSLVVDRRALGLFEKLVEEAVEQGEQQDGAGGGGSRRPWNFCYVLATGCFQSLRLRTALWKKQHDPRFIEEETEALRRPVIYRDGKGDLEFEPRPQGPGT